MKSMAIASPASSPLRSHFWGDPLLDFPLFYPDSFSVQELSLRLGRGLDLLQELKECRDHYPRLAFAKCTATKGKEDNTNEEGGGRRGRWCSCPSCSSFGGKGSAPSLSYLKNAIFQA